MIFECVLKCVPINQDEIITFSARKSRNGPMNPNDMPVSWKYHWANVSRFHYWITIIPNTVGSIIPRIVFEQGHLAASAHVPTAHFTKPQRRRRPGGSSPPRQFSSPQHFPERVSSATWLAEKSSTEWRFD